MQTVITFITGARFGMSAIMNGIALHGGYIPYGGTFLIFMEYARNALRMSALMHQRVIYVFTHDSIGLGEMPHASTGRATHCDASDAESAYLAPL